MKIMEKRPERSGARSRKMNILTAKMPRAYGKDVRRRRRKALSALEIAALTTQARCRRAIRITLRLAEESIQKKVIVYDKKRRSALRYNLGIHIKSMRGSDPDAVAYYLAKMIYAGEDPRFIARRIVICASEDVGNADAMALSWQLQP